MNNEETSLLMKVIGRQIEVEVFSTFKEARKALAAIISCCESQGRMYDLSADRYHMHAEIDRNLKSDPGTYQLIEARKADDIFVTGEGNLIADAVVLEAGFMSRTISVDLFYTVEDAEEYLEKRCGEFGIKPDAGRASWQDGNAWICLKLFTAEEIYGEADGGPEDATGKEEPETPLPCGETHDAEFWRSAFRRYVNNDLEAADEDYVKEALSFCGLGSSEITELGFPELTYDDEEDDEEDS